MKTEGNQGEHVVSMGKGVWGKANPGTNSRRKTRAREEKEGTKGFQRDEPARAETPNEQWS